MGAMTSAWLATTSASFGDLSAAVSEFWVKDSLTRLTPNLHFVPLASQGGPGAWKQLKVGDGHLIHFWKFPVMDAQTTGITEDASDPAAISSALTGITAQVVTYGGFVLLSDTGVEYSFAEQFAVAKEEMAQSMMRTVDSLTYGAALSGATVAAAANGVALASASVSAGSGSEFNLKNIEYVSYLLKSGNVRHYPQTGAYKGIVHPFNVKDIRASTATREYVDLAKNIGGTAGEEALRTDRVGRLTGIDIYETTEISEVVTHAATTASAYQCIFAGYESIGAVSVGGSAGTIPKKGTGELVNRPMHKYRSNAELIVEGFGSSGALDPLHRRATVGFKVRYVATVLDAARIYQFLLYHEAA